MASIGLVLSGGFAKGAYQIGVLKALSEFVSQDSVMYISASSVGSLNAYAYAADKLKNAEEMWRNLNMNGMSSFLKVFSRTPYVFDYIDALVDGGDIMKNNLYVTCLNVTNITKIKLNYINLQEVERHKIKEYLKASVSLPVFSRALKISNRSYFDGALIDNIPIFPLMKYHLDYIIVVHFDNDTYTFENEYFDNKLIKINFLDNKIIKNTLSFDKTSILNMMNSGYEQSKMLFEIIFRNGADDLEYIYEKIGFLNMLKKERKLRITGDVVVSNINRFLKKFVYK